MIISIFSYSVHEIPPRTSLWHVSNVYLRSRVRLHHFVTKYHCIMLIWVSWPADVSHPTIHLGTEVIIRTSPAVSVLRFKVLALKDCGNHSDMKVLLVTARPVKTSLHEWTKKPIGTYFWVRLVIMNFFCIFYNSHRLKNDVRRFTIGNSIVNALA